MVSRRALGAPGRADGVGLAGVDEQGVGVAVDDAMAGLCDGRGGEPDDVLAGHGDRVGDRRGEEPAGRRPQHPEERVHEDLRRLGADRVALLPGLRALLPEAGDQVGQDPGHVGAERGAARRADEGQPGRLAGRNDVGQGIDVEGADQARVEALEVEHEDVPVEAGDRVEDEPPGDHGALGVLDVNGRRHVAPRAELGQIEGVHRGDLRADPVDLHAGEEAPPDRQLDQPRALEDLDHEARVVEVVRGEAPRILPPRRLDLVAAVLGGEELPLAEDHLRGGVEPVVVELHEGAAEEREAVQHLAPREDHPRVPGEAEVPPHLGLLVRPAERQPELGPPRHALEDRHVEVADVPAREDVGIRRAEMAEEGLEARSLARHQQGGRGLGEAGERPRSPRSAPPRRGRRRGRPPRSSRGSARRGWSRCRARGS